MHLNLLRWSVGNHSVEPSEALVHFGIAVRESHEEDSRTIEMVHSSVSWIVGTSPDGDTEERDWPS